MSGPERRIGFVGLGNMGSALAENLVQAGFDVRGYDAAGPDRVPVGVTPIRDLSELVRDARVVVLSLPDGSVSESVARAIVAVEGRIVTHVIDTTTAGIRASRVVDSLLAERRIAYVDAPVSGGVAGARARTLMMMVAGADAACREVEPVLSGLSDRWKRVGDRAGMAQAMKLANNFLSATALAATSEAILFGRSVGLDMGTMLEVLRASSGQNTATNDKFPNHVLTGRYASGFSNSLMSKDMQLYLRSVLDQRGPSKMGEVTASIWGHFAAEEPGVDFTRIFPFIEREMRST